MASDRYLMAMLRVVPCKTIVSGSYRLDAKQYAWAIQTYVVDTT